MGMLLFIQLSHVLLMVHWSMIKIVHLLPLSFHWSVQTVRYSDSSTQFLTMCLISVYVVLHDMFAIILKKSLYMF